MNTRCILLLLSNLLLASVMNSPIAAAATRVERATNITSYPDGRPTAEYRLAARDHGPVLHHGDGPGQCDYLGARDIWVWEDGGMYFMHYDGAGPSAWLTCLATSKRISFTGPSLARCFSSASRTRTIPPRRPTA